MRSLSLQADARPWTVYTVRFCTSPRRGASPPAGAGATLLLLTPAGDALLRRVPRLADPGAEAAEAAAVCVAGGGCGDAVVGAAAAAAARAPPPPRERFAPGAIDEFSFAAPDVGPLAAIVLAPDDGEWACDEVSVARAAAPAEPARFVLRTPATASSAAAAPAVPRDAVVVGAGEGAAVLTRAEAAALRAAGLEDYASLKDRSLAAAAALVAGGTLAATLVVGPVAAAPFAAGGVGGLAYGAALHLGVDAVGGAASPLSRLRGSNPARGAALLAVAVGGVALAAAHLGSGGSGGDAAVATAATAPARLALLKELLAAALGFSMYKLGLVATVAAADAGGRADDRGGEPVGAPSAGCGDSGDESAGEP